MIQQAIHDPAGVSDWRLRGGKNYHADDGGTALHYTSFHPPSPIKSTDTPAEEQSNEATPYVTDHHSVHSASVSKALPYAFLAPQQRDDDEIFAQTEYQVLNQRQSLKIGNHE